MNNIQTRQLLIQTYQQTNNESKNNHAPSFDYHDMYLDLVDLVDDKKWGNIKDTLHSIPHQAMSYVAKKLIGRLLREKNFTEEVVSLLDYISSGCSLELRIYQILEHSGSIGAMRYYLEKGAPFYLYDIPFPHKVFRISFPFLRQMVLYQKE